VRATPLDSYLVLLRVGFALPLALPLMRCALTTPFHPYQYDNQQILPNGGIFSVALSVGSRRPDVIWHPALWSPDFPQSRIVAPIKSRATKSGSRSPGRLPELKHNSLRVEWQDIKLLNPIFCDFEMIQKQAIKIVFSSISNLSSYCASLPMWQILRQYAH